MFEKKSSTKKAYYTVTLSADMVPLIARTVKKLKAKYPDEKVNKSTFTETAINQFIRSLDEVD